MKVLNKNFIFILALLIMFFSCSEDNVEPEVTEENKEEFVEEPQEEENEEEDDASESGEEDSLSTTGQYSILALGDSYTAGSGVPKQDSWPLQLQNTFDSSNYTISHLDVVARGGWTTSNLLYALSISQLKEKYDFVGLLIGVNNQYQSKDIDIYKKELDQLLDTAQQYARSNDQIFILSIPDYSVTPFAQNFDTNKISEEIDTYNAINKAYADQRAIQYFNVTDISRLAASDPSLLANDGLHPSGKMYEQWVDLIKVWMIEKMIEE